MSDQTSNLLIKIDGGAARTEAGATQASLDKLTASGNATSGSFDKLTTATKASAAGHASHRKEVTAGTEALGLFSGATTRAKTELLVLLHELSQGNTRRFGGSLMVLAEQLGIAGKLMTPFAFGAAAVIAAIVAIGYAAVRGNEDITDFNKAMALSGGIAGATRGQYEGMVGALADGTNGKIAAARTTLNELVKSGQFTSVALAQVARAVTDYSGASGESTDKVSADFAKMTADVAKWAQEHNASYHFLTTAQYQYIADLERQGKTQEAAAETAKLLADRLELQKEPLGFLGAAWHGLGSDINSAWDAMKKWLSADTIETKVARAAESLANLKSQIGVSPFVGTADVSRAQASLDALTAQMNQQHAAAAHQSASDVSSQRGIAFAAGANADTERLKEQVATYGKGQEAVERYRLAKALERAESQTDAAARAREIADETKAGNAAIALAIAYDKLTAAQKLNTVSLSPQIKAQAEAAITAATAQEKLQDQLAKSSFDKGLTSYQQYYDSLAKIENDGYAKMAAARTTELASINSEITRLQGLGNKAPQGSIESLKGEQTTLQGQIQNLATDHAAKLDQIDQGRVDAEHKHNDAIDQLRAQLYGSESDKLAQSLAVADKTFQDWLKKVGSDAAGIDLAKKLLSQDQVNAQLQGLGVQKNNTVNQYTATRDQQQPKPAALFGTDSAAKTAMEALQKQEAEVNKILLNQPGNEAALKAYREYEQEKTAIAKQGADARTVIGLATLDTTSNLLGSIAAIEKSQGKAGFERYKELAEAQAAISAASAAIKAYDSLASIPYVGPFLGAAAAAAALAYGAVQVRTIEGQQYSAAGGFDIPSGVNPVTQLHQNEMVLPAWIAGPLRDGIRNGGGAGGSQAPAITVQVTNNTGSRVDMGDVLTQADGSLILQMAVNHAVSGARSAVASDVKSPTSQISKSLKATHGTRPRALV